MRYRIEVTHLCLFLNGIKLQRMRQSNFKKNLFRETIPNTPMIYSSRFRQKIIKSYGNVAGINSSNIAPPIRPITVLK